MKRCYRCFQEYDSEYEICPHCGQADDLSVREPQYLRPGTVLQNRYLLGIVVGAGGFGTTYAAWDKVLNQKVAVKEFLPGEFSTRMPGQTTVTVYGGEKTEQFEAGKSRFYEESRRLARFHEMPGIVHIYNSFEENGTAYIVMEFLEGETLAERLKRDKKIPEQEALQIMLPVLQALDTVHKEGILHRDIAPNNIFLTNSGEVKLLDFGAARSVTGTHSKSLTVLYKEGYTPEEQYRSRSDQGTWTDVYSCAATLYHMLTGHVPPGALERRRKDTLKAPSRAGAKVSVHLDKAVMNALNVEVKYRTQTAGQFLGELTGETRVKEHFVRTMERKVGRIPLPVIGAGAIAAAGVAIFLLLLATGVIHTDILRFSQFNVPEGMVRVPNLVNCDLETAQEKTENAGLNFLIVDKQFSTEVPENRVLTQDVQPGSIVNSETQINLVMSGGINTMTESELKERGITLTQMPDVQYQDRDEAMSLLLDMGLDVEVEYEKTGMVEGKKIIRQSIAAGEKTVEGESVIITVEDFVVDWTDAEPFETEVRNCLNKAEGDIWASEMLNIEKLGIYDLEGGKKYRIAPLANCLNLATLGASTDGVYISPLARGDYSFNATISDISELENIVGLETIYLSGINIGDVRWLGQMKLLKALTIEYADVEEISELEGLEQLRILNIRWAAVKQIDEDKLPQSIEVLGVDGEAFETISTVEKMRNLKELFLMDISQINVEQIAKLPALEKLNIAITKSELIKTGTIPNFSSLGDMERLYSVGVYGPVNEHKHMQLMQEVSKLKQIKELMIESGASLNDPLHELKLSYLDDMTSLEHLNLWRWNISDINHLCNMKNLRELTINDCTNIDVEDLKEAIQLEKLVIDGEDKTEELKKLRS